MVPVQRPLLLPAFHGSRYQAQDVFGQTSYGYAYPGQTANDYHDPFGNRIGSYAYVNPAGKEVRVSYTADARGFHVLSNDLPVAVQDTPEVATAKIEHAKALNAASSRAKRQIAVYPNKEVRQRVALQERLFEQGRTTRRSRLPGLPLRPAFCHPRRCSFRRSRFDQDHIEDRHR